MEICNIIQKPEAIVGLNGNHLLKIVFISKIPFKCLWSAWMLYQNLNNTGELFLPFEIEEKKYKYTEKKKNEFKQYYIHNNNSNKQSLFRISCMAVEYFLIGAFHVAFFYLFFLISWIRFSDGEHCIGW